jgi:hypothetical protein
LSNMTTRLQQLTRSADEKVSSYPAEMEVTEIIGVFVYLFHFRPYFARGSFLC